MMNEHIQLILHVHVLLVSVFLWLYMYLQHRPSFHAVLIYCNKCTSILIHLSLQPFFVFTIFLFSLVSMEMSPVKTVEVSFSRIEN